jgi:hypothetical protein
MMPNADARRDLRRIPLPRTPLNRRQVEPRYASVVELYDPINTPKPVGEDLWVVDGPLARMSFAGISEPFPTRMVVIRISGGDLFLWSPTEPEEGLREEIDALGPVSHLVSPNKLHYVHVCAWKRAYPEATAWASPGVKERAASRGAEVCFDRDLVDEPEEAWREDLDQLIFRGSRFMEEVVFFHRKTRTLILADFIQNFEVEKVGGFFYAWLLRLAGVADPDGKTPPEVRLTFLGRKEEARVSLEEMLAWRPEKVIMAHGRPYYRDGMAELRRAFRWLR